MSKFILQHASGVPLGQDDQPLVEAARVALKVLPRRRMIKMRVRQDGVPIEIPEITPTLQEQE